MNRTLANNIRHLMDATGIQTATELSRRCGVPQPTLHRWLAADSREPRHSKLQPLATYFGVSLDALLNENMLTGERAPMPSFTARAQVPVVPAACVAQMKTFLSEGDYETWPSIYMGTTEVGFAYRVDSSLYEPDIPAGSMAIITKRKPKQGDVVMALEAGATAPLLRKLACDGESQYLMPFRTDMGMVKLTEDIDILGVVSEVQTIRKM